MRTEDQRKFYILTSYHGWSCSGLDSCEKNWCQRTRRRNSRLFDPYRSFADHTQQL